MAFTRQQINSINSTPAQSTNLNGYSMQAAANSDMATPQTSGGGFWAGLKNFGSNIIKPVVNFGGEIAASSQPGQQIQRQVQKSNEQSASSDYDYIKQVNSHLREATKKGDTVNAARYANVIKNFNFSDGTKMSDIFPNINDTSEQVIGNAIGTGLLALSGGGLTSVGKTLTAPTLINAIKTGAVTGGIYGAVGSGANAMSNNASVADVSKSAATGLLVGAGTGAVVGATTYGIGKGIKAIKESNALKNEGPVAAQFKKDGSTYRYVETYDKGISGEGLASGLKAEDIYQNGDLKAKIYTPEAAKQILGDAQSSLLRSGAPNAQALADELATKVDINNMTPDDLLSAGRSLGKDFNPAANTENVARDVIKSPLSKDEQAVAIREGRLEPGHKVDYSPSDQELKQMEAVKPLVDKGKIVTPKTPQQASANIQAVEEAANSQGQELRTALKNSDATWNANELKGNLNGVNIPDPVKNEVTMARNATTLKDAAVSIADKATKSPDGILDVRQNFDRYIKSNYGQNFFAKGRFADPWHEYVFSLRDAMNNMAGYKLPEGALPNGTLYRDALLNQSHLIGAQETMAENAVRKFAEGSTATSRFLAEHPIIRKHLVKNAVSIGLTAIGVTAGVSALKGAIKSVQSNVFGD